MELDIIDFLIKSISAILAGAFMGVERKIKDKPAGLKTYTLVSLGASVYIMISLLFIAADSTDMTRIVGQMVVGVGFLGAGVILQDTKNTKVKGLATAATIWCSAAAGCLAGFGLYFPLLLFTIFVVAINLLFGYLNEKVGNKVNGD